MSMPKTAKGTMSEHHNCVDCGVNTAPGWQTREQVDAIMRAGYLRADPNHIGNLALDENMEVYFVRNKVWAAADMEGWGGCLCIGCLEKRIGRRLRPKDFVRSHPFNQLPGSARLLDRREGARQ